MQITAPLHPIIIVVLGATLGLAELPIETSSIILFLQNTDDRKKTEDLHSLDGAKERLQLLKADLLQEGAFDTVDDGCVSVYGF